MKWLIACLLVLLPLTVWSEHYGAPLTAKNPVSLDEAILAAEEKRDGPVLVEAKVGSVCTVKGCWLGLTGASGDVRVTFENYGFFVPPTLVGKTVRVQGNISQRQLSLAETKHYVADAGGDPDSVKEAAIEYALVATGVEVVE